MSNFKMGILILLSLVVIVVASIYIYIQYLKKEVYYSAKPNDYFNGVEFIPLHKRTIFEETQKPSTLSFLLKYFFGKDPYKWAEKDLPVNQSIPNAYENNDVKVYFINHSTLLIQIDGVNIITDPIYSDISGIFNLIGVKRVHAPGIKFVNLPKIDLVLISHNHYDHMDISTIQKIHYRDKPLIITLLGNDTILKKYNKKFNTQALFWEESVSFKGLTITAERAYHWTKRGLFDTNKALWGSFVINNDSKKIFFAGDTGFSDGQIFKDLKKKYNGFNLSLLPIGAYKPDSFRFSHTDPLESTLIHKLTGTKKSVGIHFGTFQLSQEAYDDPIKDLELARKELGINPKEFITLKPGEHILVD